MDAADLAKLAALRATIERAEQEKAEAEAEVEQLLLKLPQVRCHPAAGAAIVMTLVPKTRMLGLR